MDDVRKAFAAANKVNASLFSDQNTSSALDHLLQHKEG